MNIISTEVKNSLPDNTDELKKMVLDLRYRLASTPTKEAQYLDELGKQQERNAKEYKRGWNDCLKERPVDKNLHAKTGTLIEKVMKKNCYKYDVVFRKEHGHALSDGIDEIIKGLTELLNGPPKTP